ncbi:Dipeptidyl-peptidase 6 [Defluviimonas aquaemixtae]|uniref:Dipeptidyl-peptidase 6 n=1 Tax=Albidovulum aquaemixtae TaxID=1542388 RepID=A0A2R8BM41_9RHOB|nr:NlpC/P60 family protein [Defluviimonas aquaemixtae]SPH24477.1 Dipeptidyl-peptidase 6 [Defluviimonas aquaemixtae]
MNDRRITPANGRVAHVSLQGLVKADRFVEGEHARIALSVADILDAPEGKRDRQLLFGDRARILERRAGWAFLQAAKDGYCGYVAEEALGTDGAATHWVSAPATHLYEAPDMKSRDLAMLSLGARLTARAEHERFVETDDGRFAPRVHLGREGERADDPAAVAESLIGTPYLWGGNSRSGIDCSGLVQAALLACGIACPGDSDLQEEALGRALPAGAPPVRGDLIFWKGHVAMAMSADTLIHANAHHMAVRLEGIGAAIARIEAQGEGQVRIVRRL